MTEAEGHVRLFARAITALLRDGAAHYDLVIAPYNSGAVMVRLAERVALASGVSFWPALLMPVYTPYRFMGTNGQAMPYDNTALIPETRKILATLPFPVRSLLFIDDEIGNGRAFEECMKTVTAAAEDDTGVPSSCLIVADEDGVHKTYAFPGIDVRFRPYAVRPSSHVSGVVFDIVSDFLVDVFRGVGNGLLDKKQVASILLGLPMKTLVNGVPQITEELNRQAESVIGNLPRLRADFGAYLDGQIAADPF
jgi:hypothetical protein